MIHGPAASPAGAARRSTVTGDGGVRLSVRQWGAPASPPVLLVHGYPDTSQVWDRVAPILARQYLVTAYDVRGAGSSTIPRRIAAYRLEHLVGDLRAVIDATSPGRPVHLVGHDWGSIQGWEAVTRPDTSARIATFTSISGPLLDHVGHWARSAPLRHPLGAGRQAIRSSYVWFFHLPVLPRLSFRAIGAAPGLFARSQHVPSGLGWPAPSLSADGRHGLALYRANIWRAMSRPRRLRTTVPVQLIVPLSDPFVTPVMLEGLEEVAPQLQRHELAGGHWVVVTDPGSVDDLFKSWVDAGLEASRG